MEGCNLRKEPGVRTIETLCVILGLLGASELAAGESPLQIGRQKQLLVDDSIVASYSCLSQTLHQPTEHPANPLRARARACEWWCQQGMTMSSSHLPLAEEAQISRL